MINPENFSAIILAGGLSSRMNVHKTELSFDEKRNFLQKITEEYLNFDCREIIVVFNSENYKSYVDKGLKLNDKIKIVLNNYPEKDRLYSLKIGISALYKTGSSFIQNIDNPFVTKETLMLLAENSDKADYIIPSYKKKGGHPILISEKIVKTIKETKEETGNMKTFLNHFKKYYADCGNKKITANINTISDYHLYF